MVDGDDGCRDWKRKMSAGVDLLPKNFTLIHEDALQPITIHISKTLNRNLNSDWLSGNVGI